jgi:hypothetical protein
MIECRGRNGWFNLHHASVENYKTQDLTSVALASKKGYRNLAPIYFQGPRAEVEALLRDLLEKVRSS